MHDDLRPLQNGIQGVLTHCTVSLMGWVVLKLPDTPTLSTLLATVACRACWTGASASSSSWYWLALAAGEMSTLKGTQTRTELKAGRDLGGTAACVMLKNDKRPQMTAMTGNMASRPKIAMDE